MKIGNVEIENSLALGPMAGVTEPAISSALQRAGMWHALHGNGKCQSYFV